MFEFVKYTLLIGLAVVFVNVGMKLDREEERVFMCCLYVVGYFIVLYGLGMFLIVLKCAVIIVLIFEIFYLIDGSSTTRTRRSLLVEGMVLSIVMMALHWFNYNTVPTTCHLLPRSPAGQCGP